MEDQFQLDNVIGRELVENLQIREPQEIFIRISETFAIARWNILQAKAEFAAEVEFCALSSQAKIIGASNPCRHYCLEALAGVVLALSPKSRFKVHETLWEGERCRVEVT